MRRKTCQRKNFLLRHEAQASNRKVRDMGHKAKRIRTPRQSTAVLETIHCLSCGLLVRNLFLLFFHVSCLMSLVSIADG